jgi:F0F1-type ATP synthase assembly protein I
MDEGALKVVLGMTVAYLASFAGMFFAWYHYRKRHRQHREGR